MNFIKIDKRKGVPKYKQLVISVEEAIINGSLKKGDKLPSINAIRDEYLLSRDTVLTAFNELKARGITHSIAGKGNYIFSENILVKKKIFLLFDEFNSFKEDLYNSFLEKFNKNTQVDIFFHHFNYEIFSKLIFDALGSYNHYIIMPANFKNAHLVIEKIPKEKVYVLDQVHPNLSQYSAVYQNFKKDIFNNLTKALHLIKKYQKIILLFFEEKQPYGMLDGFEKFCLENSLAFEVINNLQNRTPKKGEIYVIPDDKNLLKIIKRAKEQNLVLGKNLGIISYNETLLKEIVEGGITTISTDFNKMGEKLAHLIKNKKNLRIENENNLFIRNSL